MIKNWIKLAFQILITLIFISLPLLILGGVLFGKTGAVIGISLSWISALSIAVFSERMAVSIYKAQIQLPPGIDLTLKEAAKEYRIRTPHLVIFSDPEPQLLIFQSLGGRGTLLMSKGLLSVSKNYDLTKNFHYGLKHLKTTGSTFRTFCSITLLLLIRVAPQAGVHLVYPISRPGAFKPTQFSRLNPFKTLIFLMYYPAIQYFATLSRRLPDATSY